MKLKLNKIEMTAIDKATGNEYGVRGFRCGPLDKNQDGVEITLDKAHNGYPIPRRWDEVEVSIEIPAQIRWEDGWIKYYGYVGKQRVARIAECRSSAFGNELIYVVHLEVSPENFLECKTLCNAKAEAQRLFDEWMGGLFL